MSYSYAELKKLGQPVVFTKCRHKSVNCKNRLPDGYCCVKECCVLSDSVKPVKNDFRIFKVYRNIKADRYHHQKEFKRKLEAQTDG